MKNLNKKIVAFGLAAIMVLSMVGCGSKKPSSMFEGMREALGMSAYELELEMTVSADDDKVIISAEGAVDKENQAAELELSAKYNGISLDIGTLTVVDGWLYYDASSLLELAGMSEDDLMDVLESIGIEDIESATVYGLEIGQNGKEELAASENLSKHMISALEAGAGKDEGCVSGKDGKFTMAVDHKNLTDVATGVLEYVDENLDDIWDELMTVIEAGMKNQAMEDLRDLAEDTDAVSVDVQEVEDILDNAEDYKDDVEDALNEALDNMDMLEDMIDEIGLEMDLDIDFSLTGKKGSRVCDVTASMEAEAEGQTVAMDMSVLMTESKVTIDAPSEFTDAMEILNFLAENAGSSNIPEIPEINEPETEPVDEPETDGEKLSDHGEMISNDGTVVSVYPAGDFTYDADTSDNTSVFLDYNNGDYNYAFIYLYDLSQGTYTPEDYFDLEVQKLLDNTDEYPDGAITEYTSVEINGYEIWYAVFTYTDDYGDVHHELYSYSVLKDGAAGVSVEMDTYSDDEWNNVMNGDAEAILDLIYGNIEVQ